MTLICVRACSKKALVTGFLRVNIAMTGNFLMLLARRFYYQKAKEVMMQRGRMTDRQFTMKGSRPRVIGVTTQKYWERDEPKEPDMIARGRILTGKAVDALDKHESRETATRTRGL